MSPRPTIVEMSHVTPSPTGSDVTAGEMAAPFALTPSPPATPSPPPHQVAGDAPPAHGLVLQNQQEHNNNVFHEDEPILPELHPFIPYPPYTSELDDVVPLNTNLPQVLRKVCGTDELWSVRQLRLRVISRDMSLQRLCLHVPNLRDLTLDGSSLLSLRDLGCRLVHLRKLRVARCGLDSLDGLFGLMNLRELQAADNSIDDIGPCSVLPHIKRIDLSRNRVTNVSNLSFLRVCTALKHVSLAGCPAAEDVHYRTEVRRRMPQLVSLDGEPLHRGAVAQDPSDDDSEDDSDGDDNKGVEVNDESPFSSAGEDGGESDDDDHPYPGGGDAGPRPGSGRREMLPPLHHSMAPLPPLRPLHPLPPIGSRSRPSSAGAGVRSTSAIVADRRPNTGCSQKNASRRPSRASAEDDTTDTAKMRAQTDPCNVRSTPPPTGNVAPEQMRQRRGPSKQSEVPDRPAHKKMAAKQPAEDEGSHLAEKEPNRSPSKKMAAKQPAEDAQEGSHLADKQPNRSPYKKMAAKQPAEDAQEGSHLVDKPPDRNPSKKLTHVDCLTLDMEERVKRWTDEILDNPALENLEEKMTQIAAEDEPHPADDEDDGEVADKPGPSGIARRK